MIDLEVDKKTPQMASFKSQIPNGLTVSRIVAVPVLVMLLEAENYKFAFLLFILAGLTDGLDGWLAKRFGWVSDLGTRLDPLADKILLVAAFIMLGRLEVVPFWLVTLVIFRDVLIVGGYMVLATLDVKYELKPTLISKLNTFLQITLVIIVLLNMTGWLSVPFINLLEYAVAVSTIVSGIHYLWIGAFPRNSKLSPETTKSE